MTDKLWILHLNLYDNDNNEIHEVEKHIKLFLLLTANNQLSLRRKDKIEKKINSLIIQIKHETTLKIVERFSI